MWQDKGGGKVFERKAQERIASLGFGVLKRNYYLKFEKKGRKRKREIDAIFIDLPIVILFEMKRIREDTSERHVHRYLGKFKSTCYLLENEERVFIEGDSPSLKRELGIPGAVIWRRAFVVPDKIVSKVKGYAETHNAKRKIDVDVVSIRQLKVYIKSLYL